MAGDLSGRRRRSQIFLRLEWRLNFYGHHGCGSSRTRLPPAGWKDSCKLEPTVNTFTNGPEVRDLRWKGNQSRPLLICGVSVLASAL